MANTQLSVLRTGVRSEIKLDRLGKIWYNPEVDDAIGIALEEIEAKGNYKFPQNQTDVTFNTVISTQEYDMETEIPDFQGIELVQYDDKTLYPTTLEKLKRNYTDFVTGTPTHYYTYWGNIGLHPYPNAIKSVDVTYKKFVTLPTTDTEESPYPKAFDKAVKLYAAYTLLSQPADNKNLGRAKSKLDRFKKEIAKLYNAYLLPDRENIQYATNYRSRSAYNTTFWRVTNPNNL